MRFYTYFFYKQKKFKQVINKEVLLKYVAVIRNIVFAAEHQKEPCCYKNKIV